MVLLLLLLLMMMMLMMMMMLLLVLMLLVLMMMLLLLVLMMMLLLLLLLLMLMVVLIDVIKWHILKWFWVWVIEAILHRSGCRTWLSNTGDKCGWEIWIRAQWWFRQPSLVLSFFTNHRWRWETSHMDSGVGRYPIMFDFDYKDGATLCI